MFRPLLPALMVLLALPQIAVAEVRGGVFAPDGTPSREMQRQFEGNGSPKLLRGVDVPLAFKDKNGKWQALEDDACFVAKFHISPEGVMDRYVFLDSDPQQIIESSALYALSQWRFEKSDQGAWVVFPWTVAFTPSVQSATDTRLTKQSLSERFNYQSTSRCANPTLKMDSRLPPDAELLQEADMPIAPRETVKARQEGCATLVFDVLADGSTANFEALDAKPGDSFVTASAVAVSTWKFNPTPKKATVPRRAFVRFAFHLNHPKTAAATECMSPEFAAEHYQPSVAAP